ncbi:MAG: PQQ-dependent sugar dehydrogenase [Gillisia sp.]
MKNNRLKIPSLLCKSVVILGAGILISCNDSSKKDNSTKMASVITADQDNANLTLPQGFGAIQVADDIGRARHITVDSTGTIYVKLENNKGDGIIVLKDTTGDGKADVQKGFGNYGGTGIELHNNFLYASSNTAIFRYKLDSSGMPVNATSPDTIVDGLLDRNEHNSKSITFDNADNLYVNIGAYSNNCQVKDRTKGSPGIKPCPILDSAGGIWQFKADRLKQTYGDGKRYVTGIRNVVGLDWNDQANQLYIMMHGRDQLHSLFPDMFTEEESSELPAETMYAVKEGDNVGWPYVYYDQIQKKKILAPEYGGNGKKTAGEDAIDPVMAFPGHMAPDGLLFYTGDMFPAKYKNGAFIAFHGSWNRNNQQKGYMVAFVPFENGKPKGDWEIFAQGFAGTDNIPSAGDAKHRPVGLAQGPDGSLYVSDDAHGTIYRIIYNQSASESN